MRGGAGVYRFHDSVVDVTSMFAQAENVRYTDLQGFGDNTLEGVNTLHLNPNTYGNAGGTETSIPLTTVYGLDPTDNKEPVTNNYSLSIAQQMPMKWILQVSYVGNNSNSLMDNGTTQTVVLDNINAIPVGYLFTPAAATADQQRSPATRPAIPPAARRSRPPASTRSSTTPATRATSPRARIPTTARSSFRTTTPTPTTTRCRSRPSSRSAI